MNYKRLSNEELSKYPYPNLIAEIIESGYGLHTISDFMGHGNTYETKKLVEDKLTGKQEILAEEALGLAYYYGVSLEYLFSPNLNIFRDVPAAYLRWYDKNKQKKEESERYEKIEFINRKLRERPYLVDFMKKAVTWSEEQLQQTIDYLNSRKIS